MLPGLRSGLFPQSYHQAKALRIPKDAMLLLSCASTVVEIIVRRKNMLDFMNSCRKGGMPVSGHDIIFKARLDRVQSQISHSHSAEMCKIM